MAGACSGFKARLSDFSLLLVNLAESKLRVTNGSEVKPKELAAALEQRFGEKRGSASECFSSRGKK